MNETEKTVLFVCTENAGRSQLAEAIFNSMAPPGWQAASAGTRPAASVYPGTIEVLKESGIDAGEKIPRLLTSQLVDAAQIVITMGCGDEGCPLLPVESEDWGLPDLKGKPLEDYRDLREMIFRKVEALVRRLRPSGG
ncbi:MAG: low molecular weight phosphatase family protein [Actinobacteria bacterium]|nr:low molecular weight phosphatase family protein [Actinomycetota bacterium]MCL5882984.1 low molecular weight phosphatase family protein [Actinomycetota bacterium]